MTMKKEIEYTKIVNNEHIKSFGQYFTNNKVAHFMCSWASQTAKTMLDPAVGNSIFLCKTKALNRTCKLYGYEIDKTILDYFGNPSNATIKNNDYLLNDWDKKYDAIVCNPPYNRFQAITNRHEIVNTIFKNTGVKYSNYTNLYTLFLLKSIYQLTPNGKLAYIIPTEFLNSKYGTPIKEKLLNEHLIKAIINFENDQDMFFNATTTCCILLLDHSKKNDIIFYNLKSINELDKLTISSADKNAVSVSYNSITATEKWRIYVKLEDRVNYQNLVDISKFCKISRGIATGANDYFCFSKSKLQKSNIPLSAVRKCICRSADVKNIFFSNDDFQQLSDDDKTVYLLDKKESSEIEEYIKFGEKQGLPKKYLLSHRNPWYSMEQKETAPIWIASASRNNLKFVRNLTDVRTLSTFHSIFVHSDYIKDTNIIFSYFLTPIAQQIIRENRKELGNRLEKFQPNDLNNAKMFDITLLSASDYKQINKLYYDLQGPNYPDAVKQLNKIFSSYMIV